MTKKSSVIAVASVALVAKLCLAASTSGSHDLLLYQTFASYGAGQEGGLGLYRAATAYTDTPFLIHLLRALRWAAEASGASLLFWLRVPSILADAGTLAVLWQLLESHTKRTGALLVAALSPVALLLSGFQGGMDSVMIFFVLLSALLLQRMPTPLWGGLEMQLHTALAAPALQRMPTPLWGGLAFGMALNVKVWPLLLVPAILAWLPDVRRRWLFAATALVVVLAGSAPVLFEAPRLVLTRVFTYGGMTGGWGIPRWLAILGSLTGFEAPAALYIAAGKYLTILTLAAGGLWLQRKRPGTSLAVRLGWLTALFLVITPVFELHYLAWLAPWGVLLGPEALLLFSYTTAIFLVSVYNHWGGGFPWRLADPRNTSWTGLTIVYEILSWASTLVLFLVFHRQLVPAVSGALAPTAAPPVPRGKSKRRR